MATAYLCFGSNLGDRLKNFSRAEEFLVELGIKFVKWSSIYKTEPISLKEGECQPWFLNAVAEILTDHSPLSLLLLCKDAEKRLGRYKDSTIIENGKRRYFPRTIDIDLLFYEDSVIDSPSLEVPHPRFHARKFVLMPFKEIAPDLVHPVSKKTIAELLQGCKDSAKVHLSSPLSENWHEHGGLSKRNTKNYSSCKSR